MKKFEAEVNPDLPPFKVEQLALLAMIISAM